MDTTTQYNTCSQFNNSTRNYTVAYFTHSNIITELAANSQFGLIGLVKINEKEQKLPTNPIIEAKTD